MSTFERFDQVILAVLLLIDIVHDGGEDGWFDLSHLSCTVFFTNDFIESSETSAKSRIEMIFDVIISSAY